MPSHSTGLIRSDEAYSKPMVLERLGVSQKFWDQMLNAGLPFAPVGHGRWVLGADLIEFLKKHSVTKQSEAL
jgi:hypothetical protein